MHHAASNGKVEAIKTLTELGADIHTTNNVSYLQHLIYLNQARASLRPAHAWFLKIDPKWIVSMCVCVCVCVSVCLCVCVFVCPPPRLLITSGLMWHNMDPIQLVKQVL